MEARGGAVSDADPQIAARMTASTAPWPEAAVIDTESGGTAGVTSTALRQALSTIRPDGPEYVWLPRRPVMLPG